MTKSSPSNLADKSNIFMEKPNKYNLSKLLLIKMTILLDKKSKTSTSFFSVLSFRHPTLGLPEKWTKQEPGASLSANRKHSHEYVTPFYVLRRLSDNGVHWSVSNMLKAKKDIKLILLVRSCCSSGSSKSISSLSISDSFGC